MRAVGEAISALTRASTWRLALRGLGRQPRRSGVVLAAIAIGLGSLLVAMALQYGLVAQMAETAIRTEIGDLQAHALGWRETAPLEARMREAESLAALPAVKSIAAFAPRLRGEALAQSPRASVGVRVLGVDPTREPRVSTLARALREGAWLGAPQRIVIGAGLARRLRAGVGDKVVLAVQDARGDLSGEALRVGGIVQAPSRELDEAVAILRLADAQRLYGVEGEISEIAFTAPGSETLADSKAELSAALGSGVRVETWRELEPLLDTMITMFDQVGWVIYAAIFVAMAFGIANVLLMSVLERTREIGVLLAIGMPPARMVAIVLAESVVLVMLGVALGFGLGFAAIYALRDGIDLSSMSEGLRAFGVPTRLVPVARAGDVRAPLWVAAITAFVASLWPALRAVRTRPAEALRRV
jgi:ABC-type lipoprotein release transport system permease subunit